MIGKSVPRVDAYEKVTGRAKFTDDLILNKCLVARVYHAKIGNGIVKSIDTSKAEALDGVVKVVTFKRRTESLLSYAGTSLVCGAGTSGCCRPQYPYRKSPLLRR